MVAMTFIHVVDTAPCDTMCESIPVVLGTDSHAVLTHVTTQHNWTLLHHGAESEHAAVVGMLMRKGATVDARSKVSRKCSVGDIHASILGEFVVMR